MILGLIPYLLKQYVDGESIFDWHRVAKSKSKMQQNLADQYLKKANVSNSRE
jgi:hypothetical protein